MPDSSYKILQIYDFIIFMQWTFSFCNNILSAINPVCYLDINGRMDNKDNSK